MAMDLNEFFDMAESGGQIKACHDIFEILQAEGLSPEERTIKLSQYQDEVLKKFTKLQLKFKMGQGKVRMDEDSIDKLG